MTTKINLFLVGIGTGNPDHVTRQAEQMLRGANIIMMIFAPRSICSAWRVTWSGLPVPMPTRNKLILVVMGRSFCQRAIKDKSR